MTFHSTKLGSIISSTESQETPFLEASFGVHQDYVNVLTHRVDDINIGREPWCLFILFLTSSATRGSKNTIPLIEKYLMSDAVQGKILPTSRWLTTCFLPQSAAFPAWTLTHKHTTLLTSLKRSVLYLCWLWLSLHYVEVEALCWRNHL